uniref:Immunoglobulin V-set domain-containing protein n=1 Tax=Periophthalmus magnuspinnatus TaxID=409849 RepID=A0A3B4B872_9GOBI
RHVLDPWSLCAPQVQALSNALSFITPSPMEALSGSCLWIPCTYKVLPPYDINTADPVTGFWFKGVLAYETNSPNTFSVSGDSSKSYPMNIAGNLKNKNCTTMFYNLSKSHNDKYYFRVENSGFKGTARCDSLQITVRALSDKAQHLYILCTVGQEVFIQPRIVQVLPLKKMREACNFHYSFTSTMRDRMGGITM